jgi:hypothetical protein
VDESMTVSPKRQARTPVANNRSRKAQRQSWLKRVLRLESLEKRQLMAADLPLFHNDMIPWDVNGDFAVSPLDALVVINRLNTQGSSSLTGQAPADRSSYIDVTADNFLSPLDALSVINALNNGEGQGELVEVKYDFLRVNADGTAGAPFDDAIPENGQPDAIISPGQKVIVRTSVTDLRRVNSTDPDRVGNPRGVFSAYHDLNFTNDVGTAEKLLFQWGEFNQLSIKNSATGGTFRLRYGANETAAIPVAFAAGGVQDSPVTAANIQAAIEALPGFGAGNVKVVPGKDTDFDYFFEISYVNALSRTNIPDFTVSANNLTGVSPTITPVTQANPNPATTSVAAAGLKHDLGLPNDVLTQYSNGRDGKLQKTSTDPDAGAYQIALMGGFTRSSNFLTTGVATQFIPVVDALFVGGSVGLVSLAGTISPLPGAGDTSGNNLGIALFGQSGGRAEYLPASRVILPTGSIRIADRLTAINDELNVNEDAVATAINVVQNDIEQVPSLSKRVLSYEQPATGGTVSGPLNGPNVLFTPAPDFNGTTSFRYTVTNNAGDTSVGTVLVTVTAVNDAPVVIRTTPFTVAEDTQAPGLTIAPTDVFSPGPANESAQAMTISLINVGPTPAQGTATLSGGSLSFVPAANFFGNVVLQVTGTDDSGVANDSLRNRSTVATITINVTGVNDAPNAFSGTLQMNEDDALILIGTGAPTDLLLRSNNGLGEPGTPVLASIPSTTSNGGTITTVNNVTTYRPALNFNGQDSFVYTVRESDGTLTGNGTITITVNAVNDPAVAVNDTGVADRFAVPGITADNNLDVMRNDNPGAPNETRDFFVVSVTPATIGTVSVAPNGAGVIFVPPTGQFNVTSTFSYTIRDSLNRESTANVEVLIIPPILPFALGDSRSIAEKTATPTVIDVLSNDFANADSTRRLLSFTQPSTGTGTVTLNDNGTPTNPSDDTVSYVAPTNYFGSTTFTYTMIDSAVDSNNAIVPSTATVTVQVTPVNDPPVAEPRFADATEDTTLVIPAADIIAGLSKGPGEDAQVLTITNAVSQTPNSGTVSVVNGNIQYVPARDFFGEVLVVYTVTDNGLTGSTLTPLSASATLTITVAAVNDAPISVADEVTVAAEDTARTFAISSLTGNDLPGPANEANAGQVVTFVPLPSAGVNTANGGVVTQSGTNLIYTPAANYNGPDSFTYTISDGQSSQSTTVATATIRVTEVNDAPSADTLTRSVFASVPTTFDLTQALAAMPKGPANESGQTLRVTATTPDAGFVGTLVSDPSGTSITYTAPLGASGRVTFTYEVTDNGTTNGNAAPLSATGTFNIDISPFIPSSVKGFVYIDDNNSGSMDPLELKMGGVEVTLVTAATGSTPSVSRTEKTLADGSYNFDLLPPGAYTVSYAIPILTDDAPGANSHSVSVVAPGDVNVVHNFGILGVQARYANLIEYMSSIYDSSNPRNRTSGIYAAVNAEGISEWTIARNGFEGDAYQEVVLSNDGTEAFVTSVRGDDRGIYTATLGRRQFVQVGDTPSGSRIIRVMARSEELVWTRVSLAAPPVSIKAKSRGYLETVDDVFAEQGW